MTDERLKEIEDLIETESERKWEAEAPKVMSELLKELNNLKDHPSLWSITLGHK